MMVHADRPIAIYHEHPHWFQPLFQELERRGTPFVRLDAAHHRYEVTGEAPPYGLVFNRMSPSAWLRGNGHGIFYTLQYLHHLEHVGVRVVNGHDALAALAPRDDLVTEHRAGELGVAELLDIGAA